MTGCSSQESTRRRSPPRSSSATRPPARSSARGARRTPTGPRSTPPRGGPRTRRRPPPGCWRTCAPSPSPGQQHGMVALDEDAQRRAKSVAVERHPFRRRAASSWCEELGGPQAWADAVGHRAAGQHHRGQAALVRRARAGARRPDARRGAAARLADRADRRVRVGGRRAARHRPRRRVGHRLLVAVERLLPHRPADAGVRPRASGCRTCCDRTRRRGPRRAGWWWAPGPATTWGRRWGSASVPATSSSRSGPAGRCSGWRRRRRRTRPGSSPGSPTRPAGSCPWSAPSTRPGSSPPPRPCSAPTTPGLDELALSAKPGAGGLTLLPYLDGERTPDLPDATGTLGGLDAGEPHAGQRRPGGRGGHAVRPGRRAGRVARQRRPRPAGPAHRWRRAVDGGAGGGRAGSSGLPVSVPSPGEYVALGAARQAAWVLAAAGATASTRRRAGRSARRRCPTPGGDWAAEVRGAYRRLRGQMHGSLTGRLGSPVRGVSGITRRGLGTSRARLRGWTSGHEL